MEFISDLVGSLAWPIVVAVAVLILKGPLTRFLDRLNLKRAKYKDVEMEFGDLPRLAPGASEEPATERAAVPDWTAERAARRARSRHVALVHVAAPSQTKAGWFDVATFLVPHKRSKHGFPEDLSDIEKAEFFLGRYWGNRVVEVTKADREGRLGFSTSAYGPALCLCRVTFGDGEQVVLDRYLDFESVKLAES